MALIAAAATVAALAGTAAPAGAGSVAVVKPVQPLVELRTAHAVLATPGARASRAAPIAPWRPITGGPTVLPVLDRAMTADGAHWLRVGLPGRPNGRTGWIRRRGTVVGTTTWHVVVNRSRRQVLVYRRGAPVRDFAAIVGKPSTPTPRGRFFVEESVEMLPGSAGAPFALALSARSNVLQEFEGGPGQIAIHGVLNLGGTPGTAVSHGCVRLANRDIRWLAARIAPGVPVTITS